MPNAFRRTCLSVASLIVVVASLSYIQARGQASPTSANSVKAKSEGFSRTDLMRLRPVLFRDLVPTAKLVYNDPDLRPADIEDAFLSCRFTPLRLGKLGPAVLVEWDGLSQVSNVAILNIYIPSSGSYRKIIAEEGFGPSIVPHVSSSVPDLLFGWASGVCHASFSRYSYDGDKYKLDACDEEYPSSEGNCDVRACKDPARPQPLPTFPDPTSWNGPPAPPPPPYFDGPTLTAKQILSSKQ